MVLLHEHGLASPMVGILRQELDSLVRVIYLLSIRDKKYRKQLIEASIEGERWTHKGKRSRITDREMVALAQHLHGWTQLVYRFGCAFVHLSNCHDHGSRDPLKSLAPTDRAVLLQYMRQYHHGPSMENPKFADLIPYIPRVFEKVAGNLECYLSDLEKRVLR